MGNDDEDEEVDVEQFDHDTDVIPEALLAAVRMGRRAATSADWPPPPPRPAPQKRRARIYSVARRPGTSSE